MHFSAQVDLLSHGGQLEACGDLQHTAAWRGVLEATDPARPGPVRATGE